jgi:hypothetical protein
MKNAYSTRHPEVEKWVNEIGWRGGLRLKESGGVQRYVKKEKWGHSFGRRAIIENRTRGMCERRREMKDMARMSCRFLGILTETAGLTLGLEQAEDVVNTDYWCEKYMG